MAKANTGLTTQDGTGGARRWMACGAILSALGIASFSACRSSEGGVPIEDFPRLYADAACNNLGPCCAQAGFPHDAAQCHAAMERSLQREFEMELLQPNRAYDAVAARACLDAGSASTPISRACTALPSAVSAPCRRIFVGTLPVGQACLGGVECVPGSTCYPTGDGAKRQCTDWNALRGKLGQSCLFTCTEVEEDKEGVDCSSRGGAGGGGGPGGSAPVNCFTSDGLYCESAIGCAKIPAIGEACSTDFCAGEAFCDQGICAPKRTSGPCGLIDSCAATAYCAADGQCELRKATGEACTSDRECPTTDLCDGTCRLRTFVSAQLCSGNF